MEPKPNWQWCMLMTRWTNREKKQASSSVQQWIVHRPYCSKLLLIVIHFIHSSFFFYLSPLPPILDENLKYKTEGRVSHKASDSMQCSPPHPRVQLAASTSPVKRACKAPKKHRQYKGGNLLQSWSLWVSGVSTFILFSFFLLFFRLGTAVDFWAVYFPPTKQSKQHERINEEYCVQLDASLNNLAQLPAPLS